MNTLRTMIRRAVLMRYSAWAEEKFPGSFTNADKAKIALYLTHPDHPVPPRVRFDIPDPPPEWAPPLIKEGDVISEL
jgi:hypothetical protein